MQLIRQKYCAGSQDFYDLQMTLDRRSPSLSELLVSLQLYVLISVFAIYLYTYICMHSMCIHLYALLISSEQFLVLRGIIPQLEHSPLSRCF